MRLSFFVIALFVLSCQERVLTQSSSQINIDSLLHYQIEFLSQRKVSLLKNSVINRDSASTSISDVNWETELESFRAIDLLNKPIYADQYEIELDQDIKSNLKVKTWTAKRPLPLRSVRVLFLENPYQIKSLEAEIAQENRLFNSSKTLTLDFNVLGIKASIISYRIRGQQKFFGGDSQTYDLQGVVR